MSDSDGGEEAQTATQQQNDAQGSNTSTSTEKKVPKHLRARYWTSWEEMKMIEMWRRYSDEVVTLKTNIPVFRKISEGMRESGFQANGQEVRRKINSLKNKYIGERRRIDNSDNYPVSEWKPYPLVHCLLSPKKKSTDLRHETTILNQLFAKVPQLEAVKQAITAAAAAAAPPPFGSSNGNAINATPITSLGGYRRSNTTRQHPYTMAGNASTNGVGNVLKRHFTRERLEQLRADNMRLLKQRDDSCKKLQLEEQNYKMLESMFTQWQHKHEQLLTNIT